MLDDFLKVRITAQDRAAIKGLAKRWKMNQSDVLRTLLRQALPQAAFSSPAEIQNQTATQAQAEALKINFFKE